MKKSPDMQNGAKSELAGGKLPFGVLERIERVETGSLPTTSDLSVNEFFRINGPLYPAFSPFMILTMFDGVIFGCAEMKRLFMAFPELKKKLWKGHLWNPSYYLGTAGDVSKETIKKYIELQKGGESDVDDRKGSS